MPCNEAQMVNSLWQVRYIERSGLRRLSGRTTRSCSSRACIFCILSATKQGVAGAWVLSRDMNDGQVDADSGAHGGPWYCLTLHTQLP